MKRMGAAVTRQQTPQEMLLMAEKLTIALGGKIARDNTGEGKQ